MQKLRSIQVLRGIAAMAVVVYHATGYRFGVGAAGVDLFFVISGFIMAHVSQGRSSGDFMLDRLWRIVPLYFAALVARLALFPAEWSQCRTLASLTLWPSWPNWCFPYVFQGWTLSYELFFYAMLALCISRQWLMFAILPAIVLWRLTIPADPFVWLGNPMILEFLMGMALARAPRRHGWITLTAGLVGLAIAPTEPTSMMRVIYWGIPAALIFHGTLCFERALKSELAELPVQLGNASYSIYLFQFIFLIPLIGQPAVLAICTAGVGGYAVHRLVEKPLLRSRRPIGVLAEKLRNATLSKAYAPSQTET